ncbi:MAG: hypothetical protein QUT30_20565 [Acidobacteriota bacterium]|mgnify:CR=1 FL=1|jgi:YHS domain-containing protein|nr:hypothetical protein [Acidobacteriota bacterium]
MLSMLLRILSAIFLVWILRRLFLLFLGKSRIGRTKGASTEGSNPMVKDPVCGMYMDSRLAIRLQRKQEDIYFCSENCKQKYLNQAAETVETPSSNDLRQ